MKEEKRENIFTLCIPEIGYEGSVSIKVVKKSAEITIVNYGNDPDLAAAIDVLNNTFNRRHENGESMFLRIKFKHATSSEGITQDAAKGINAVYIFGNINGDEKTYYEEMSTDIAFFNSKETHNIDKLVGEQAESASGWKFHRQYKGGKHQGGGYFTWEDEMKAVRYNDSIGNTAIFATNILKREIINIGGLMTKPERYALAVLHVMGHNAGLDHQIGEKVTLKEREIIENWMSPITTGQGLARRINDNYSYDDVVFNKKKPAKVWRDFVKSYFNPYSWNGDPNNSSFLMESIFKEDYLDLFLNFSRNDIKLLKK